MVDQIGFCCDLTRSEHALEVSYEIGNQTGGDIGVLNAIFGLNVDRTLDFSPDNVFVDLENGALHVVKGALPLPAGLHVLVYVPPYGRRLAAGESFSESFTVKIPVRVRHPFKRMVLTGEVIASRRATTRRVTISVGVVRVGGHCRLLSEHPAYPDVMTVFPPDSVLSSQTLLSKTFSLGADLQVLDYEEHPWR